MKPKLAVLVSGRGSNLQALIDATETGSLNADISVVVSNNRNSLGLRRAKYATIPTFHARLSNVLAAGFSRTSYDLVLAGCISAYRPDLLILAGWNHILSKEFIDFFEGRIINLHPALPGMFPGKNAIRQALEAYKRGDIKMTGAMVHWVVPEIDAGPPIAWERVDFKDIDILPPSLDPLIVLRNKVKSAEHKLIVKATISALADLQI